MPRAHIPDRLVRLRGLPQRATDEFDVPYFDGMLESLDDWNHPWQYPGVPHMETPMGVLNRHFPDQDEAMGLDTIFGEATDDL